MIFIIAPSPVDGVQSYGPHDVYFKQGLAKVESLPWGVESFMREHGYQIDKPNRTPAPPVVEAEVILDGIIGTADPAELVGETGPELVELPKGGRVTRVRKPKSE